MIDKNVKDGFYWLTQDGSNDVSLVRVYTHPLTLIRGIGYPVWESTSAFIELRNVDKSFALKPFFRDDYKDAIQELLYIQGTDGNWDWDPYMHGLYNGLEMALSVLEHREANFREAPKKWGADKQCSKKLKTPK